MEITFTRQQTEWLMTHLPENERRRCFYTPNQDDHPELGIEKPGTLEIPDAVGDREHVLLAQARELSSHELGKPALLDRAKQAFANFHNAGTSIGDMKVATDDNAKTIALLMVQTAVPGFEIEWHGLDGQTYRLDDNGMRAVATAITRHIARGFEVFAAVKTGIEGGHITTNAQVDAAFTD